MKTGTRHRTWVLAIAGAIATANVAHAATNEELEARLNRMEQMLQETRADLERQKQATARAQQQAEQARQAVGDGANGALTAAASADTGMGSQARDAEPGVFRLGENTTAEVGGYIKVDSVYNHTGEGTLSKRARQFYVNGAVPVGDGDGDSSSDLEFNARQTRVNLTTLTELGDYSIKGFVEADFYGDNDNASSVTGGFQPRLRHAYIELNDTWLMGQTWSNFMDLAAYPETLDFVGPNEGQVFIRNTQLRYTRDNLSVAIEDPASSVDAINTDGTGADEEHYPDLTVNYDIPTEFGHLSGGLLGKVVTATSIDDASGDGFGNDKSLGYGVRVSGLVDDINAAGDDFKFQAFYGDGIGRYVALGTVPSGIIEPNGDVDTISAFGGYANYRHYWSDEWRSNLVLGALEIDNPAALENTDTATKRVNSVHANLLWNPVAPLTLGGEYLFARRTVESGLDGNLHRVQVSARYDF